MYSRKHIGCAPAVSTTGRPKGRAPRKPEGVREIAGALNIKPASPFVLYLKTKNFHWHVSSPHFRDYHLLLDKQGEQIFATTR